MAQQHNDNIPYYEIFSIREYIREGETKSSWLRIGAGFKNRDESFGLVFQAMPLPDPKSGLLRLYMRPFRPEAERDTAHDEDGFFLEIDPLRDIPLEEW